MEKIPELCECKKAKGRKIYDIFRSWNGDILPFDDLDEKAQIAWVMTGNGKKCPLIAPSDEEPEEEEQHNEAKPKKERKPKENVKKQSHKKDKCKKDVSQCTPSQ